MKGLIVLILVFSHWNRACAEDIRIGAKSFTESVTLANIARYLAQETGATVVPVKELGGTKVLWSALVSGEIDIYPEYTGTLHEEIFNEETLRSDEALRQRLAQVGVSMTGNLGFNNSYAIAMFESRAIELGIHTISDLAKHPGLKFGFSNEFIDRGDGWPSLRDAYRLQAAEVRGLEHALAYRAIDSGEIDVIDAYTTDPNIREFNLRLLSDDRAHFPKYDAIFLYRTELEVSHPDLVLQLNSMVGQLDDQTMLDLNQQVELHGDTEQNVAARYVNETYGFEVEVSSGDLWSKVRAMSRRIWKTTLQHLFLVSISLGAAIIIGVPAGIIAAKTNLPGQVILGTAEIVQTIPGLALLVFMGAIFIRVGLPSIGAFPVIVALFLYSLLPIIRNTMAGLTGIPGSLQESATALGLGWLARLRLIELPLAAPLIIAGIKTTAVINVGYAALGGLIGAGGYGQPIMTGLRLNSEPHMLEGAIPAAIMAITVKYLFEYSERFLVSPGLRVR